MPTKFAPLSPKQEQTAIEVVTVLDWTLIGSPLPARAIAEEISVTHEQGEAILIDLRDRELIDSRLEHPGNNLAETGHIVINHYSKWFRVEPM